MALYEEIVALRPEWHSEDDKTGAVKVVMTGAAADVPAWQPHIGNKARRDLLAKRAKDPADPLRLVIVRDMWLTGFDAPSMHTMYIDKPMRGHGLMQAIARVNRVFRDKPAGLVVDYIGIAQNLKKALGQYSASDAAETGIDEEAEAVAVLLEKFDVVRAMFHGFDCTPGVSGTPVERLKCLAEAIEFILARQHEAAAKEASDGPQGSAPPFPGHRARADQGFHAGRRHDGAGQSATTSPSTRRSAPLSPRPAAAAARAKDRDFAVQQLIDKSVVSTEIVDILRAAGLTTPDNLDPVRRLPR
ncbi:type I restriction enzyme subunit R domain-containing protein [Sphingomonas sp. MMS24-JH45]